MYCSDQREKKNNNKKRRPCLYTRNFDDCACTRMYTIRNKPIVVLFRRVKILILIAIKTTPHRDRHEPPVACIIIIIIPKHFTYYNMIY